jgi:hypothetical protein
MHFRILVLFAAFLLPLPMMADTTYYFTGSNFSSFGTEAANSSSSGFTFGSSSYSTSDSVSGWFTVSAPLAANSYDGSNPKVFSFSDGQQTINETDAYFAVFELLTASDGSIKAWEIDAYLLPKGGKATGEIMLFGGVGYFINGYGPISNAEGGNAGHGGEAGVIFNSDGSMDLGESVTFGSWSTTPTSATPEPSSIVLMLSGLAGRAGVARRKFLRA